jgi:hypothetical protein
LFSTISVGGGGVPVIEHIGPAFVACQRTEVEVLEEIGEASATTHALAELVVA